MGGGPPCRRDTVRYNFLEEAQPPEADHESARGMEAAVRLLQERVRFFRLSSAANGGFICAGGGLKSGAVPGSRGAIGMYGIW